MPALKNQRWELFSLAYIVDFNATKAAKAAGYSESDAAKRGCMLLSNQEVASRIEELMRDRKDKIIADSDYILKRLFDEAEADMSDIYDDGGNLKPVKKWPKIWRQGLVAGVESVGTATGAVVTKVKLSDRIKRLELLGKHVDIQAFRERTSVENPDGSPLQVVIRRFGEE